MESKMNALVVSEMTGKEFEREECSVCVHV